MTTMNKHTDRLHFRSLRRAKGLTSQAIADAAGISLTDEYLFEIHCLTKPEIKRKIVQAFSHLAGQPYQVSDFEPASPPEEQPTLAMNTLPQGGFKGRSHDLHQ